MKDTIQSRSILQGLGAGFKETVILALLTFAIALLSIVVMDIIIYPVSTIAVARKSLFSTIVFSAIKLFIVIIPAYALINRIIYMVKNRYRLKRFLLELFSRPLYYLIMAGAITVAITVMVVLITLLLNFNSSLLQRLI